MLIFGSGEGCFVEVNSSDLTKGKGARGVLISFGKEGQAGDAGSNAVVTGVDFVQRERYAVTSCFNNKNFIYAFGHDPASSTINVTMLISVSPTVDATGGSQSSTTLRGFTNTYNNNRASKGQLGWVTYGGMTAQGLLVGMTSGAVDPRLNLQSVVYQFLLLKSIGEK